MRFKSQMPVTTASKEQNQRATGSQASGDGDSSVADLKMLLQRTLLKRESEGQSGSRQQYQELISTWNLSGRAPR